MDYFYLFNTVPRRREVIERIFMPRRNFEVTNDFTQLFRLSPQTVDYLDQRIGADICHDSL